MRKNILPKNVDLKLVFAVVLVCAVLTFAFYAPFAAAAFRRSSRVTIVLDAGHGGMDGGVVGTRTGVKESDLNLKLSKIVGEYLVAAGFNVVYTRTNSHGLYTDILTNAKKRDDMHKRGSIINRADPAAVVSIHMNFYTSPARRGAQVFFNGKNEKSREFGQIMQELLNGDINRPANGRDYAALSAEKYILECSPAPVIIVECGFLSNPIDEANLIDPDYQIRIGYTIFQGIAVFCSQKQS